MREGVKVLSNTQKFDRLAKSLEVVSASPNGRCVFKWTVDESQLNGLGTLHGGYTAFMLDYSTSAALMVMEGNTPGVSVDMSVSYMNAARPGDVVYVETECKKRGKNLAFLEAAFKKGDEDGKLIATGKHTKFIGN